MKKFFTEIVNAIKGVKPVEGTSITNQIAEAVTVPFEKVADEIEFTISTKVDEAVAGEKVTKTIETQVTNAVEKIDFSKDGAPKTAIENAAKSIIENSLAAEGDNAIKAAFNSAVENATKDLKKKNEDLEQEITNLKGKKTITNGGGDEVQPIGSFKK